MKKLFGVIALSLASLASHADGIDKKPVLNGTFTGTLTGVSSAVTATITYTKVGDTVILDIPQFSGTSNTVSKTITGLPSILVPTKSKRGLVIVSDNSGAALTGEYFMYANQAYIDFYTSINAANWTAAGTATITSFTLTYNVK